MKGMMEFNDFKASIHYSSEDDVLFGKIIGIDDSITFEGSSISSLKKAFKDAVEDYISICREIGKEPLKSYKGTFNVRIDPDLHKEAVMKSSEQGISLNQFVENAISNLVTDPRFSKQKANDLAVKHRAGPKPKVSKAVQKPSSKHKEKMMTQFKEKYQK